MAKPKSGSERDAKWYAGTNGADGKPKPAGLGALPKFVRGELDDQEKTHLKAQQFNWDDIIENLVPLVEAGYKVSIGEDFYNHCFATWITAPPKDNPNSGFILQGRGPDVLSSVACAFYKHFTKFAGAWPIDPEQVKRDAWG